MRSRREWQPYVDALAARMRLGHWRIIVKDEPPDSDGALAAMTPWDGRYVASLWLADNFLTNSPTDQRYTITHELVHCYQAQANALFRNDLSAATEEAWRRAHEYGVDQVATVIAETMPLPDEILGPERPEPPATVAIEPFIHRQTIPISEAVLATPKNDQPMDMPAGIIRNATWPDPR